MPTATHKNKVAKSGSRRRPASLAARGVVFRRSGGRAGAGTGGACSKGVWADSGYAYQSRHRQAAAGVTIVALARRFRAIRLRSATLTASTSSPKAPSGDNYVVRLLLQRCRRRVAGRIAQNKSLSSVSIPMHKGKRDVLVVRERAGR